MDAPSATIGLQAPLVPGICLRVFSLGGGMQSSSLGFMAARGEIGPVPDRSVFVNLAMELRSASAQIPYATYIFREGAVSRKREGLHETRASAFRRGASGRSRPESDVGLGPGRMDVCTRTSESDVIASPTAATAVRRSDGEPVGDEA